MTVETFKVWVTLNPTGKRPVRLQKYFLNANPRLLTIWFGEKRPDGNSVRATLTLDADPAPKQRQRRRRIFDAKGV